MKKATPEELKEMLDVVDSLVKSGIMFVPIPVLGETDLTALKQNLRDRLDQLAGEREITISISSMPEGKWRC